MMSKKVIFALLVGLVASMLPHCTFGISDDGMSNNEITDGGNDDQDTKDSRKYDPSIFDILGSDYFDDDHGKSKDKVMLEQGIKVSGDAPQAPKDVPVEPIVEVEEEEVSTSRPFCVGCPIEADPENEKVKSIAVFAFTTHRNGLDALDQAVRMVRVVNAMTQVVAGQKYILDLEVGVTNCTKNEEDEDSSRCTFDPNKSTFICNFEVVEQAWANSKEVVRSKCSREDVENDADADVAPLDDEDDTEYQKEETEPVIELGSDEMDQTTTVLPEDEIIDRRKRDTPSKLGGHRDAEESKEMLMDLATFAVQQLDAIDPDEDARLVMEVVNAKKQTVSGWLYDLDIRVAYTTCPENQPVSLEKCKDKIVTPYRICSVKILFQPWQTVQKKVTESQCYPEKYKKGKKIAKELSLKKANEVFDDKTPMLGGYQHVDVTSQELTELVNYVVDSIDERSNAMHAQKIIKVLEAQKQVVSGVKTKLVLELGYTSCRKQVGLDKSQCEIDEKREHQVCNVTVWEQPWLKSKKITNSRCGARKEMTVPRNKRSLSLFSVKDLFEPHHEEFKKFIDKYNKNYETPEEYRHRLGVFQENMKKVKLLQEYEQGTATYGATHLADLTEEEFSRHYLGLRPDLRQGRLRPKQAKIPVLNSVPDEFDWRNYNAVTPVKNQGMCGSCWAFSVTGNIEGIYAKKHNQLVSFSEQELVDCDTLDEGCNGGLPENAYKSIQKLGGLETESAYPYDGHNDKCSFDSKKAAAKVTGFVEISKNETEMAMWLVKNGPISIGINANAMQFYFGGVSHPWKFLCGKKSLDHGVLIVGYGVHNYPLFNRTLPFWTVKNSWGANWGEQGYYRVYRGDDTCGLAEMATSAVVE